MAVVKAVCCVVLLQTLSLVHTARILLQPIAGPSHVAQASSIGEALLANGHEVYMVLPSSYPMLEKHRKGPFKLLTSHFVDQDMFSYDMKDSLLPIIGLSPLTTMKDIPPGMKGMCTNFLSDDKLYVQVQSLKFDLIVLDGLTLGHCGYIFPYRLGVPYVSFASLVSPLWTRNPGLPSHVPHIYGNPYTEKMSFWERLDNLYSLVTMAWSEMPPYNNMELMEKYAPEKPVVPIDVLLKESLLWFIDTDPVIDYPRASMPNEIMIGGMTTGPAKPLHSDLEAVVKAAQHGVIVMSFGSGLPDLHSEKFLQVFARLKQVVFWRHLSDYEGETPVPSNVHMLKWLPQSDLLGHNNTRLFITHCGANGQFEALYHGVPMLGFPGFGDQPYNGKRMVYHGFGKTLNILAFTEFELYEAIMELLNNPSYKENISQASKIYRDTPMRPMQRVVYWIEHVLKYGGDHLRSHALHMPWYTYYMLDVLTFLCLLLSLCGIVIYLIFKFFYRKLFYQKPKFD